MTVSALVAAAWARWRRGQTARPPRCATSRAIAVYPAVADRRASRSSAASSSASGSSAATSSCPENKALGASDAGRRRDRLGRADAERRAADVDRRRRRRARRRRRPRRAAGAPTRSPCSRCVGMAALPWAAFLKGHPFRIRYMVPLIAVEAIGAGIAAGIVPERRLRAACAIALLGARRLRAAAARRDGADGRRGAVGSPERAAARAGDRVPRAAAAAARRSWRAWDRSATTCRRRRASGFAIRDFLHEGNGDIWLAALERPAPVRGLDADRGEGRRRRHARAASRASGRRSSTDTRASAKAPGWRSIERRRTALRPSSTSR